MDERIGRGDALPGFTADAEGFDAFYQGSARQVLRQLYAMCGDLEEARDCLQEGYARAWQRWDQLASYDNPAAWVRTAAWRVAISRWRRARRLFGVPDAQDPQPDAFELLADLVTLSTAIGKLPPRQREAVVLHHLAGLSIDEIAAQVHSPPGTMKARLSTRKSGIGAATWRLGGRMMESLDSRLQRLAGIADRAELPPAADVRRRGEARRRHRRFAVAAGSLVLLAAIATPVAIVLAGASTQTISPTTKRTDGHDSNAEHVDDHHLVADNEHNGLLASGRPVQPDCRRPRDICFSVAKPPPPPRPRHRLVSRPLWTPRRWTSVREATRIATIRRSMERPSEL
jgi:RNA polymerase sigma-70 factor (ECF subfamily)